MTRFTLTIAAVALAGDVPAEAPPPAPVFEEIR